MMPQSGLHVCFPSRVMMTFELLTIKVYCFVLLPSGFGINRFISFQNIVFVSSVTDERRDGRTDGRTDGQTDGHMNRRNIKLLAWRTHGN